MSVVLMGWGMTCVSSTYEQGDDTCQFNLWAGG